MRLPHDIRWWSPRRRRALQVCSLVSLEVSGGLGARVDDRGGLGVEAVHVGLANAAAGADARAFSTGGVGDSGNGSGASILGEHGRSAGVLGKHGRSACVLGAGHGVTVVSAGKAFGAGGAPAASAPCRWPRSPVASPCSPRVASCAMLAAAAAWPVGSGMAAGMVRSSCEDGGSGAHVGVHAEPPSHGANKFAGSPTSPVRDLTSPRTRSPWTTAGAARRA
ncbi:hypothetical protein U9M48_016707 [Paspalum notatum var. saurae]|uniref:Uncharacterized protein n=1 Tax=Paspalum notatum var. saurae TaxID=547442 RepID=A0AAQ3T869_PASNO